MSSTTFDNLITRLRECDRDLQNVSDELSTALNSRLTNGATGLMLRIAEDDVIRLRTTVDAITRQLLYGTWSAQFKDRIDDSMRASNWLFPGA